jgi:polyribonucleotide nucleotidyltransferase
MKKTEFSMELGGKTLTAEFSDLAENANGSVILRLGKSAVLATAVMSKNERQGIDYFPLTVDYEEKFYAAGAILGSRFMRREGRPSEEAILSGRIVDRTIRPLFDQYIRNEVQVVVTVLSLDEDDPDVLAINAASLALAVSDIPWHGPVSAVRVGKHNGNGDFQINPTYTERNDPNHELDMMVCGRNGTVNMIEVGARMVLEDVLTNALKQATEEHSKLQEFQSKIVEKLGKKKRVMEKPILSEGALTLFEDDIRPTLKKLVFSGPGAEKIYERRDEWVKKLADVHPDEHMDTAASHFEDAVDELLHSEGLDNNTRADGRGMDEVRELYAEAGGVSEMIHGTGIFYRGGTHVLSALTLGGPEDSLIIDSIENQDGHKRFMHHYNFPPFSTGETGRLGGMNRRMIGHGALAEKALTPVIPPKEDFPYTIRIVSEAMASNGSTSMASVCGSTLALMDGGVPISSPVAGIAMGLLMSDEKKYKVLTDIQGPEDHYGDMDFKVSGTSEGVTAVQMDVKVGGIPISILEEAFDKARSARLHILETITSAISEPRVDISPHAPKILTLTIKQDQIGLVIGSGGKTIKEIKETTGVDEITIEDDGTVYITGRENAPLAAKSHIEEIVHEYKVGEKCEGEVIKLADFGAFVKISPSAEGLVHISEIAPFRIEKVADILKVGDRVPVIVKAIDENHRIKLSIKDADPNFANKYKST